MLLTYCHLPHNRLLLTFVSSGCFWYIFEGSLLGNCGSRFLFRIAVLSFVPTGRWPTSVSLRVCICIETLKNPLLYTNGVTSVSRLCSPDYINHSNTTVNYSTTLLCETPVEDLLPVTSVAAPCGHVIIQPCQQMAEMFQQTLSYRYSVYFLLVM